MALCFLSPLALLLTKTAAAGAAFWKDKASIICLSSTACSAAAPIFLIRKIPFTSRSWCEEWRGRNSHGALFFFLEPRKSESLLEAAWRSAEVTNSGARGWDKLEVHFFFIIQSRAVTTWVNLKDIKPDTGSQKSHYLIPIRTWNKLKLKKQRIEGRLPAAAAWQTC